MKSTYKFSESQESFRLLFESSYDPFLIFDGYKFIDCNEPAVKILGFSARKEIINSQPEDFSPEYQPDNRKSSEKAKEMVDIAYKKGYHRFEWVHISKNKKEIFIDVALTKIPYHGQSVLFTVWRDMTRQKQYEMNLAKSEKLYSTLFEQAADGILVGIGKGEIIDANQSVCDLTGYNKDELIGQNIKILFNEEQLEKKPLRYDLVKAGDTVIRERQIVSKTGKVIPVEMNTKILEDGRMQALFRDLSVRKEAEKALIESEEKYRNVFYHSPLGILHYNKNGVITDCNQYFVDIIGSSRKQLVGLNMIKDLNNEQIKEKVKQSISEGEGIYEDWYTSVTGNKTTFVRVVFKCIYDDEKNVISGIGLVEDITERKKAEMALSDSEQKYRMLFEKANDAIMLMDNEIFIDCNKKTLNLFGCSKDEIIGKPPYKFSPEKQPDGRSSKEKAIEKINEALQGKSNIFEWVHQKPDGTDFYAEVSLNVFEFLNKKVIQAIVRDISERKEIENMIRSSEEKFRNIFNTSNDIILIIDLKGEIINANQSFFKSLDFYPQEVNGKNVTEFIAPKNIKEVKNRILAMSRGESVPLKEVEMISKSGNTIPLEVNSKLIDYDGKKAIMSVIRDIRERKEFEQRIYETIIETEERERQRLASDIHDEIGPLLSSLKVYIESLNQKGEEAKQIHIKNKLQELIKETINNVREVSNAISPYLLNKYGLETAIGSFIKKTESIIRIRFKSNIKDNRFPLKTEVVYFRVIKELLNNTIKHAQAKNIHLNLQYVNGELVLNYQDDGIGLDNKYLSANESEGMGLFNIINRINSIQGDYKFYEQSKGFKFKLVTETTIIDSNSE